MKLKAASLAALFLSAPSSAREARRDRPPERDLNVGDPAPDFELSGLDGKEKKKVKLSSFKGKEPVVLIFGSYT